MAFKIWGLGSIVDKDNFDGTTDYSHIESIVGDDVNNHITQQRVLRNLYENQHQIYSFLERMNSTFTESKGIFKDSLENELGFSGTTDAVSLMLSSSYEETEIQTVGDSGGSLSGTYFFLNTVTSEYYVWFNTGGSYDPGKAYPEITDVTVNSFSTDASELDADYFLISSPSIDYYVWINVDTISSDPTVAGRTGIEVNVLSTDNEAEVTAKIKNVLDAHSAFSASTSGTTVTVENVDSGIATDAADSGVGNFSISITQQGRDDQFPSKSGIEVPINIDDNDSTIADKIDTVFEDISAFIANYSSGNTITIINTLSGDVTNASDGDTGFTITTLNEGADNYRYYTRIAPGIAYVNGNMVVNIPQTHIAERQLEKIFGLRTWLPDPEYVKINYDYTLDKYDAEIVKYNSSESLETHIFNNGGSYYNTGIELLKDIYNNNIFHRVLIDTVGTDLTKILLEPTFEITTSETYYIGININGEFISNNSGGGELPLWSFITSIGSGSINLSSITDLRVFFQNFNDFGTNLFLNVPPDKDLDTNVIDNPITDTNYDYTKVENNSTFITILRQSSGNNDNIVVGWQEGALPAPDDEFSDVFYLNKDIVVRYGAADTDKALFSDVVASAESTVSAVDTISTLPTGVADGVVYFVRNVNQFWRYSSDVSSWIPVSDPHKQHNAQYGVKYKADTNGVNSRQYTFNGFSWKLDGTNLRVYINGIKQDKNTNIVNYEYDIIDHNTIEFNEELASSTDRITVEIITGGEVYYPSENIYTAGTSKGVYDGDLKIFPVDFQIARTRQDVYVDGVKQRGSEFRENAIETTGGNNDRIIDNSASFDGTYVGNFVLIVSGDNTGEVRQVSSNPDSSTLVLDATLPFNTTIDDNYEIYTDYDFFSDEYYDQIEFSTALSGGEYIHIEENFTIAGNWDIMNKGNSFPADPVFGHTFYREDLDSWYKHNGNFWIQI